MKTLIVVLMTLLLCWTPAAAQAGKPITKKGLVTAIQLGGLSSQELVQFVRQRGVDFRMSGQDETELKEAGAQADLLKAVRENYRGAPAAAAKAEPAPPPPPPAPAPDPQPAPPSEAPAPPPPTKAKATPAAKPAINSLSEVRKIYVDPMPDDLDQYIRAEIHKQMKGKIEVVLRPEEADGILTGVGEKKDGVGAAITGRYLGLHDNATGSVTLVDRNRVKILWADEAGDRSLLLGAFKRGGQRKVADRLVSKLKKAMKGD
jgi:hypothetical protein